MIDSLPCVAGELEAAFRRMRGRGALDLALKFPTFPKQDQEQPPPNLPLPCKGRGIKQEFE